MNDDPTFTPGLELARVASIGRRCDRRWMPNSQA